jgi:hypothetical protein
LGREVGEGWRIIHSNEPAFACQHLAERMMLTSHLSAVNPDQDRQIAAKKWCHGAPQFA